MQSEPGRRFTVDFASRVGRVRALNGLNIGPVIQNGMLDLSDFHRRLKVPLTRLHDCSYAVPETVDIHHIFPDFRADPDDPSNYRFARTDAYIQSILDTGSQIVYRLGETIDHFRVKPFIDPPADSEKWARVCVNIIRHYNEGWANGYRHGIRFWEIWNEPMNPPCWSGSWEQFLGLYETAARRIKAHDPALQVGGPGMAGDPPYWELRHGFVEHCARRRCPLDFFSWHIYTDKAGEIVRRATEVRELLDRHGMTRTASHLNEWNYLVGNSWGMQLSGEPAIRRDACERQLGGAAGAAFTAAVLMLLQDAPVDEANYYQTGDWYWGLFDGYGAPRKPYFAMKAFARLLELSERVAATGGDAEAGLAICAAAGEDKAAILLSNQRAGAGGYRLTLRNLPWHGATSCVVSVLDDEKALEAMPMQTLGDAPADVPIDLPSPGVCLVELCRADRAVGCRA